MLQPTRDQARQFFIDTWHKHLQQQLLTPLEAQALDWLLEHPEYHTDLEAEDALTRQYDIDQGRTNPFLHLSMHLAITEQLSIDQPPGIRTLYQNALHKWSAHEASHEIMECLGQIVWQVQRSGLPPNNDHYLELIRQRLSRD